MTKTIKQTLNVTVEDTDKPRSSYSWNKGQHTQAFSGSIGSGNPGLVNVGIIEESISFGDVAPGMVLLYNTDPSNFVTYGTVTADLGFQLEPQGVVQIIGMKSGDTLYMKADTAACDVFVDGFNA